MSGIEIEIASLEAALARVIEHREDARKLAGWLAHSLRAFAMMQRFCDEGSRHYVVARTHVYPSDDPGACLEICSLVVVYATETGDRATAQVRTLDWRRPVTPETAPDALRARASELRETGESMGDEEVARWAVLMRWSQSHVRGNCEKIGEAP